MMRKKPDFLLLLSVLVVSGVIFSHFFIINHTDNTAKKLIRLNTQYAQIQVEKLKLQEIARIDLSKQQIR